MVVAAAISMSDDYPKRVCRAEIFMPLEPSGSYLLGLEGMLQYIAVRCRHEMLDPMTTTRTGRYTLPGEQVVKELQHKKKLTQTLIRQGKATKILCSHNRNKPVSVGNFYSLGFPDASPALEAFGLKFSSGGAHISRTMMLAELDAVLAIVPVGSSAADYRAAILNRNVLGKTTDSTRQKSLRHLRELYALDEATPIFGLLRKLHTIDAASLPLLAVQVAWVRDPLFRATTPSVMAAEEGDRVEAGTLAEALEDQFPGQYSDLNRNKIGRNSASSWTQSGHFIGRAKKTRQRVNPTPVAVTMALFLGQITGYHGARVFSNPWCRLLDLNAEGARAMGQHAHRAGLLNLRAIGEVVELSFPLFAEFQGLPA